MKSSSLRIGNWYVGYDNKPKQWTLKDFSFMTDYNGERALELNEIIKSPIPLTEQWLLDFGFNKFEGIYVKSVGNGGQIHIEKTINHYMFDSVGYKTYFDHVHNLQNLYYALTRKELTLNR